MGQNSNTGYQKKHKSDMVTTTQNEKMPMIQLGNMEQEDQNKDLNTTQSSSTIKLQVTFLEFFEFCFYTYYQRDLPLPEQLITLLQSSNIKSEAFQFLPEKKQLHVIQKIKSKYFKFTFFFTEFSKKQGEYIIAVKDESTYYQSIELEQLNNYKIRLLSSISHELKTPLSGIFISLQTMNLDENLPLKLKQDLIYPALCSTEILNVVIGDIIDYANMHLQSFTLNTQKFNFKDLIEEVCYLYAPTVQDKDINLKCYYENKVPEYVNSDGERIKSILINLMTNACKFTGKGGTINMSIVQSMEQDEKDVLIVTIKDTGCGIHPDQQKLLKQQFQKIFVENDSNEVYKQCQQQFSTTRGAGIGLIFCQVIAKGLYRKGKLDIQSILGEGTQISFKIYNRQDEKVGQLRIKSFQDNDTIKLNNSTDQPRRSTLISLFHKTSYLSNSKVGFGDNQPAKRFSNHYQNLLKIQNLELFNKSNPSPKNIQRASMSNTMKKKSIFKQFSKTSTSVQIKFDQNNEQIQKNEILSELSECEYNEEHEDNLSRESYDDSQNSSQQYNFSPLPSHRLNIDEKSLIQKQKSMKFVSMSEVNKSSSNMQSQTTEDLEKGNQKKLKQQKTLQEKIQDFERKMKKPLTKKSSLTIKQEIKDMQVEQPYKIQSQKDIYQVVVQKPCDCTQILLVDDDQFNLSSLQNIIKQFKVSCDQATNGQIAIDKVKLKSQSDCCKIYKVILMDIDMPVMNGYESVKNIQEYLKINLPQFQDQQHYIINAHTAADSQDHKQKCKDVGMAYSLKKPLNIKRFKAIMEQYCNI